MITHSDWEINTFLYTIYRVLKFIWTTYKKTDSTPKTTLDRTWAKVNVTQKQPVQKYHGIIPHQRKIPGQIQELNSGPLDQ
jgi:hypothetical protein